jgi:hypothetical protein
MTKSRTLLPLIPLACVGIALGGVNANEHRATNGNIAGEVRAYAVDPGDQCVLRELHRAGWLEATGQTLSTEDFPAAYARIGRAWTPENTGSDRFALPDLRYLAARPGTVDSVARELLGGDLVRGGRLFGPPDSAHLLYCVYVAKDVSESDSDAGRLQRPSSH